MISHKLFGRLNKNHGLMFELVQQNHLKAVLLTQSSVRGRISKYISVI